MVKNYIYKHFFCITVGHIILKDLSGDLVHIEKKCSF